MRRHLRVVGLWLGLMAVPSVVVAAKRENLAYGELVPRPRRPVEES